MTRPVRLKAGEESYLGAGWAEVAALVGDTEDQVSFRDLPLVDVVRLYEAGRWYEPERRGLPGVRQLVEQVRNGAVPYFTFYEQFGRVGIEEGRRQVSMGDNEGSLVHTAALLRYDQSDLSRWPEGLHGYLLNVARLVVRRVRRIARIASKLDAARTLLWLRVTDEGISAPEDGEVDADSVVVDFHYDQEPYITECDFVVPIFRTWARLHGPIARGGVVSLSDVREIVLCARDKDFETGVRQCARVHAKAGVVLDGSFLQELYPLAGIARLFPDLGVTVSEVRVCWKRGVKRGYPESVMTVFGPMRVTEALARMLLVSHPDVDRVEVREGGPQRALMV